MNTGLPRKLDQHVTIQHIGPETLVYDESRHQAFCLNATSAAVWNRCDGTRTSEELADAASTALGVTIAEDVVLFALDELRRDGLLEAHTPALHSVTRRALVQRLSYGSALLLPIVSTIVAPKPAQAYSGCFDCTNAEPRSTLDNSPFGGSDNSTDNDDESATRNSGPDSLSGN